MTLTGQGRYVLGVKAVLVVDGVDETESVVVWSDNPLVVAEDTFGVLYFKNPKHPTNLRK